MGLVPLNEASFEIEINSAKHLAVCFFWAAWCPPCKHMRVVLNNLEKKLGDTADFFSVNLEEYPRMSDKAGVLVVPTIILYKSGRAVERFFGKIPDEQLASTLEEFLVS